MSFGHAAPAPDFRLVSAAAAIRRELGFCDSWGSPSSRELCSCGGRGFLIRRRGRLEFFGSGREGRVDSGARFPPLGFRGRPRWDLGFWRIAHLELAHLLVC